MNSIASDRNVESDGAKKYVDGHDVSSIPSESAVDVDFDDVIETYDENGELLGAYNPVEFEKLRNKG